MRIATLLLRSPRSSIAALVAVLLLLLGDAAGASMGDVDLANCALCQGLQYCTAMNGKLLFDPVVGYTREKTAQLQKQGVCEDLDVKTLQLSRFGDTFQFKDTARCRQLVWNYHCLSWVANTFKRVVNAVSVSCTNAAVAGEKPLPPCRSLCVEVADKCVYSHFYRDYLKNVCGNVPCVSEEEEAASNGSLTQPPCIKAPWESVPNTSFSRCSIRESVPPKAAAATLGLSTLTTVVFALELIDQTVGFLTS